jgi:hypothetical protein
MSIAASRMWGRLSGVLVSASYHGISMAQVNAVQASLSASLPMLGRAMRGEPKAVHWSASPHAAFAKPFD